MKLLLYCTKAKPNIVKGLNNEFYISNAFKEEGIDDYKINGKIVAECDFDVEEIYNFFDEIDGDFGYWTKNLSEEDLSKRSCITKNDILDYINNLIGYAIHIKNLHIFDEPKYLDELWAFDKQGLPTKIEKAPQNMMKCHLIKPIEIEEYILISIHPEWLCKILNGEKTIEVRKRVLKEMLL